LATLGALDEVLFHMINSGLAQSWLDAPMMFISSKYTWVAFAVVVSVAGILSWRGRLLSLFLLLGITVGVTDLVTYQVVKPFVGRERPCRQLSELRMVPIWCGGDYGMPSNHAANGMAVTVILALNAPPLAAGLALALMLITGFSRVYLGVHFPGDVLAGIMFGALVGFLCHHLFWWAVALGRRMRRPGVGADGS